MNLWEREVNICCLKTQTINIENLNLIYKILNLVLAVNYILSSRITWCKMTTTSVKFIAIFHFLLFFIRPTETKIDLKRDNFIQDS